jgi:hypothetical protein
LQQIVDKLFRRYIKTYIRKEIFFSLTTLVHYLPVLQMPPFFLNFSPSGTLIFLFHFHFRLFISTFLLFLSHFPLFSSPFSSCLLLNTYFSSPPFVLFLFSHQISSVSYFPLAPPPLELNQLIHVGGYGW